MELRASHLFYETLAGDLDAGGGGEVLLGVRHAHGQELVQFQVQRL